MEQLQAWIWLTTQPGVSLRGQQRALDYFGTPERVYSADKTALAEVPGLSPKERDALGYKDLRRAEGVLEDCRRLGISILTIHDSRYPQRLKNIDTPPLVLYYRGTLLPFDELPAITVVGARKASVYGLSVAKRMGQELGACGATVVSGAARGIDSYALEGALEQGASVAAVLGNGLDIVYPSEAKALYGKVERSGCLISEFVPGTKPLAQNFPRRNRMMSGLSVGVLVVEAAKQSGSLITAELALEQGRDVFAVPGNIGLPACEGSNALIQDGAALVTCGWDILREYTAQFSGLHPINAPALEPVRQETRAASPIMRPAVSQPSKQAMEGAREEKKTSQKSQNGIDKRENRNYIDLNEIQNQLTEDERTIAAVLSQGRRHVDDIIEETALSPAKVLSALTLLEIKGFVTQEPGKHFSLKIQ